MSMQACIELSRRAKGRRGIDARTPPQPPIAASPLAPLPKLWEPADKFQRFQNLTLHVLECDPKAAQIFIVSLILTYKSDCMLLRLGLDQREDGPIRDLKTLHDQGAGLMKQHFMISTTTEQASTSSGCFLELDMTNHVSFAMIL